MNLSDLKKEIPYKWRVQSFSRNKPKAQCVAYIDARDVENLLDTVCSPENWQDEYYQVKNTMLCRVGIKINNEWIWKSDGGVESNMDKEKGELSDSFKRACVKWGIGRFLYDLGIQYVGANEVKNNTNNPYPVDENGKRIWDLTKYINEKSNNPINPKEPYSNVPPTDITPPESLKPCDKCGGKFVLKNGKYGDFYGCSGYSNGCKRRFKLEDAAMWMNKPTVKTVNTFEDGSPISDEFFNPFEKPFP